MESTMGKKGRLPLKGVDGVERGYDGKAGGYYAIMDCFADEGAAVRAAHLCAGAAMPWARFIALFQPHAGWMVRASGFSREDEAAAALAPAEPLRDKYEVARRAFLRYTDCEGCGARLIVRGLDCGLGVFRRNADKFVCGDCSDAGDVRVADFIRESAALVERLRARNEAA